MHVIVQPLSFSIPPSQSNTPSILATAEVDFLLFLLYNHPR
jgi:hypothetical protein